MATAQPRRRAIGRRTAMQLAGAAACAGLGGRAGRAATEAVTLAIWTGYPELVPVYKTVSDAYTLANPNVKFTIFSTTLREAEQKLTAAMPTGTGPDIFDVGTNITVNFTAAGLIDPNPPDIDQYLKADYRAESVAGVHDPGRQDLRPAIPVRARRRCTGTRRCSRRPASPGRRRPSPS